MSDGNSKSLWPEKDISEINEKLSRIIELLEIIIQKGNAREQ